MLVFQGSPPSTTVNFHFIKLPVGQKLSFTAGLSQSVPRTMRLFIEFPEGCASTLAGFVVRKNPGPPSPKGSCRTLAAEGNHVTGRICLADLCHLPKIIGETKGILRPN